MNKNNFSRIVFISFIVIAVLFVFHTTNAAVNLPWSTTYNCLESNQSQWFAGTPLNCDGLTRAGNWYPNGDTSKGEQIISLADYPGGGRGQRHWIGDGVNSTSGGTSISFPRTPEFWLRAYVRYERGFSWNPNDSINHKMFYPEIVNVPGRGNMWFAFGFVDNVFGMQSYGPNPKSTRPWTSIFGQQSDESWHVLEWHMKVDTNGSDGIAEGWVDGVLEFRRTDIDFGTHSGWASVAIGENHRSPLNGRIMYFDIDDIAIATTGPIGGGDTQSPSIPSNLSAAAISSSQINLSWTASTDNIGVAGYRIYRCQGTGCTPTTQIATSATNSYSNIGLTASTVYTYRVAAYDAAGNVSLQSTSASATTQAAADTTPPASPTGLTVM